MLRAIGMSRRQVRTMIRYEAVITALIGAILGMVLGVIFAALIAQPLKDDGFTFSYPIGTLIVMLILAGVRGCARRGPAGAASLEAGRARLAPVRVAVRPRRPPGPRAAPRTAPASPPGRCLLTAVMLAKPWIRPGWRRSVDPDAGPLEPRRVGLALVAQRVEAGGGDVGGRQAGEVVGAQRRDARVGLVDAGRGR